MDTNTNFKRKNTKSSNKKQLKLTPSCQKCSHPISSTKAHYCACQTGLVNIGNSCYISAVFQTISELSLFNSTDPSSQMHSLFTQLSSHSPAPLCPDLALFELKDLWTHENLQEDAFEFLITILPLIDNHKFMFEVLSQNYCEICNYSSEPFIQEEFCFNMNLGDKDLQTQINGSIEAIDEVCENCGKGFLTKLRNLTKEPEVFMVRVMRFQINQKTGKPSKIWSKALLPEVVNVGNKKYSLSVAILHKSKALNHGHYMVYLHKKQIIIDDEKVFYNKPLKLDCSYFYLAFYVIDN